MEKDRVKVKLLIVGSIAFINLEKALPLKGKKGRAFVEKLRRYLILQDLRFSYLTQFIFCRELPQRKGQLLEIAIPWETKPKGFQLSELVKVSK